LVSNKKSGIILVDSPGYGFAQRSKEEIATWGKMMNKYLKYSHFLHRVIILIDSEHGLKDIDKMVIEMLEN
jgi:GTP-binding protein